MSPSNQLEKYMHRCPNVKGGIVEMLKIQSEAYERYVYGDITSAESMHTQFPMVPVEVCDALIRSGGWRDKRKDHLEELQLVTAIERVKLIRKEQGASAQSVIDATRPLLKGMSDKIKSALDGDHPYATTDIRRLAEAMAQIGTLLMQASALDGKIPELKPREVIEGVASGKQPWLNINAQGPVTLSQGSVDTPQSMAKTIDMAGEEDQ